MNGTPSALPILLIAMFVVCGLVWLAEAECRDRTFMKIFWKWWGLPPLLRLLAAVFFSTCIIRGSVKPGMGNVAAETPGPVLVGGLTDGGGSMTVTLSGPARLTTNQYAAGFALLTATCTNAPQPWLSAPSNAVTHAPWARYGLAEETFWLPATNWGFVLGTAGVDGAHVSSSGTLSFGWPKGSPRSAAMPDGDTVSFLAPLQGSLGTVPPQGRFWHAVTPSNSVLMTWQDLYAGRDTNSPVTFQAELFQNGDFAYRYSVPSNSSFLIPNSSFTNFVIGAQHNRGGETYALNETSLLVNGLELHWRAFGMLDPEVEDHDGDGLSTYDEVMTCGTDPAMPDTDLDGLRDAAEIAASANPLARDTDLDGIPDGGDPRPAQPDTLDADGDGLPDAWEDYRFGGTNTTDSAVADTNGDGFSDRVNMLTGTDPAALPAPGFAVTNAAAVAGVDAWEIAPAFALDLQPGLTNILTRTLPAGRTSPWQQFFISSKPSAAGAWSLDGLELSWEAGTNVLGTSAASPPGDSLRLSLGADTAASLTFRLMSSRTNGLARSPAPLYLVRWSPQPAFTTGDTVASAVSAGGVPCVAALLEDGGGPALPFTLDVSARPHNAPPGADELAERALPPDPASGVYPVFSPDPLSGHLTAAAPAEAALPASGGRAAIRVLLYRPQVIHTGDSAAVRPAGPLSPQYPLDSAALRGKWRNNAAANGTLAQASFSVSTGLDSEYLTARIDGVAVGSLAWEAPIPAARLLSSMQAQPDDCTGGSQVRLSLCGSNIWEECVEREPGSYSSDEENDEHSDETQCECGDPEGGGLGSLKFRIPLGTPGRDRTAGFLWFAMETPRPVTPALFNILGDPSVTAVTNAAGTFTVASSAENGRSIAVESVSGGVRITVRDSGNALEHRWEIANQPDNADSIRLVKRDPSDTPLSDETYTYSYVAGVWERFDGLSRARETLTAYGDLAADGWRQEYRTLRDDANKTLSYVQTDLRVIGEGPSAVARETRRQTWDGARQTYLDERSDYWEDTLNPSRNGLLRYRCGSTVPWEYHACDSRGRETLRATQLDGSAEPGEAALRGDIQTAAGLLDAIPGSACTVRTFSYEPADAADTADHNDSRSPRETVTYVIRNGTATVTAREWRVYTRTYGEDGSLSVRTVRAASPASAYADPANAVSASSAYAGCEDPGVPPALRGLPLREDREDGTRLTWAYVYAPGQATLTVTARRGTAAHPEGLAGVSTYEVETRDALYGRTLRRETRLYTGGGDGQLLAWEENTYDAKGHLLATAHSDGTTETSDWDCCRMVSRTARDGSLTGFISMPGDSHWSVTAETSLGSLPGAGGLYPATESFTDALGRETNSVRRVYSGLNPANDPACPDLATRTEYPYGTDGYSVTTDPLGVRTLTSTDYAAGRKITETVSAGVTNRTTETFGGANVTEAFWDGKWTRETRSVSNNAGGCRVETVLTESSDYPAVKKSVTAFDFLGRTVSVTTPLGVTSNVYDGTSGRVLRMYRTGSPATLYHYDELGTLTSTALDVDNNGQVSASDRLSSAKTVYAVIDAELWRVTTQAQTCGGVTNGSSVTKEQLTGLSVSLLSRTVTIEHNGAVTTVTKTFDPATGVVTETAQTDSASPTVRRTLYGYALESAGPDSATLSGYDGFARAVSQTVTNGTGTVSTSAVLYDKLGNAVTNTVTYGDLVAVNGTAYDAQGRAASRTDALGDTVETAYDSLGQTLSLSGATYPVTYAYDTAGHKVAMRTFRDENGAGDETRRNYDGATGLLTNKVYADGSRVSYVYTSVGRVAQKTWARGEWVRYTHDALGQVTNVAYSGVTTPNVALTYNAAGLLSEVSDTSGLRHVYVYTGRMSVTNETVVRTNGTTGIRRSLDGRDRPSVTAVSADGTNTSVTYYGYDGENRIASEACTNSQGRGFQAVFSYENGFPSGYAVTSPNGGMFSRILGRDPHRLGLVTGCTNAFNVTRLTAIVYAYDSLSRATNRNADAFIYNARSELTGAVLLTNCYGYVYDPIGNRLFSVLNATTNAYNANALNQYTAVTGEAAVTPTHDADGNTAWDGKFIHAWDSENRLVKSVSGGTVTNGSVMVENGYDYLHHRVTKTVRRLTGRGAGYPLDPSQAGTWEFAETRTFTYDGWNLIRETVSDTNGVTGVIEYFWGPDLSGTLQGAGGVGGLLAVSMNGNFYFPCYDNNGNVVAYVDESGALRAEYVYEAFGNTAAISGDLAHTFRFRFSTKYHDEETGLYYYGYRFHSPDLGRWINIDPLGEEKSKSFNLYSMVQNDPLNSYDMLGLFGAGRRKFGEYIYETVYYEDQMQGSWLRKTHVPQGHSDFTGGEYFDFVREDTGWANPMNPFSTGRHFREIEQSRQEATAATDECPCDQEAFERAMHRLQDFFSHRNKGYEWMPFMRWKSLGLGHALAGIFGDDPDDDGQAWQSAQKETTDLVSLWDQKCTRTKP